MAKLYGVDLEKKVTPIIARDAIITCFTEAHKEVLEKSDTFSKSETEKQKFQNLKVKLIVQGAFKSEKVNFNKPTKKELLKVLPVLADFAAKFRSPKIIEKHFEEIKTIISKISE